MGCEEGTVMTSACYVAGVSTDMYLNCSSSILLVGGLFVFSF